MKRPNLFGGLIRLCAILFMLFAAIAVFAPLLLNRPIVRAIEKHFDETITIADARFSVWPTRLKLVDVHIKNPKYYPQGDMITFGDIHMDIDFTNSQTVILKNIVFSEISAYPAFIDNVDNFAVYLDYLRSKDDKIPSNFWRWPVVAESYQTRNIWLGNQEPLVKIDDKNFDPAGSLQNPVSLQHAAIEGLQNVLTQQRKALPQLLLETTKENLGRVLDKIGQKLKEITQ